MIPAACNGIGAVVGAAEQFQVIFPLWGAPGRHLIPLPTLPGHPLTLAGAVQTRALLGQGPGHTGGPNPGTGGGQGQLPPVPALPAPRPAPGPQDPAHPLPALLPAGRGAVLLLLGLPHGMEGPLIQC
ncbi:translation initiation factor IF-2-like [Trachemys scripta elegans]|uniref:translation initiation factor IF-2-like n=1 Tax=Trachemys scripta elegans TaxID=31138 RepID=UPI0015557ACC|nr:translation initiation factor IF-2-like [Trachemys scripta elegans]